MGGTAIIYDPAGGEQLKLSSALRAPTRGEQGGASQKAINLPFLYTRADSATRAPPRRNMASVSDHEAEQTIVAGRPSGTR